MYNIFKSRTRKNIESAILKQTELIAACESEKAKNKTDVKKFCQIWTVQKDYERNIELLKSLL